MPHPPGSKGKLRFLEERVRVRLPLFPAADAGGVPYHPARGGVRPGQRRRSRRERRQLVKTIARMKRKGMSMAAIARRLEISRVYDHTLLRQRLLY